MRLDCKPTIYLLLKYYEGRKLNKLSQKTLHNEGINSEEQ